MIRFAGQVLERSERLQRLGEARDAHAFQSRLADELKELRAATHAKMDSDQVQVARLRRQVRELEARLAGSASEARRDPLTGLNNRGVWEQRLGDLQEELEEGTLSYSLALMDLDHFHLINEEHGHVAGDRVLADFGTYCRRAFGTDDFVARRGGDEFGALIASGCAAHATEHINRLIAMIHRANGQRGGRTRFTCSIGVVEAAAGESVHELLARAGAALYEAKHSGRDRVVIAV
jgi:diguanylate cyclase (GGDEF)-like protein